MKFPKTMIEKCVSKKDVRYYLNDCHLDVENKRLVATDGHKAVFLPVTVSESDTSGPVTSEAIIAARKLAKGKGVCEIGCNGSLELSNGASFPRPDHGTSYPEMDRILPQIDTDIRVSLNAQYLLDIAKAISDGKFATNVTLHIPADTNCAIRISGNIPEAKAVLMPVRM